MPSGERRTPQIVRVDSPLEMEIIGTTIDDAAGEAFDKCAKVMGLPLSRAVPVIDRRAKEGDPKAFRFAHPRVEGYDYSFSGLKTSFLYTLRDAVAADPDFIERHEGRPLRLTAIHDRRNPARQTRPRLEGDGHPRHRHRGRRLGQLGPPRRHRRDGPPPGLADVPSGVQVHDRQRRDDRHGGLLPLQARGNSPRSTFRPWRGSKSCRKAVSLHKKSGSDRIRIFLSIFALRPQ